MHHREERVAQEIKELVSEIILKDVRSKIEFFSIPYVKVTADLSVAKIYVSFFTSKATEEFAKIVAAKGFIRTQLAKKIRLRKVPEIEFILDHSLQEGNAMLNKIKDLNVE